MNSEIESNAVNGERCLNERHRFRLGVDATQATEFESVYDKFHDRLMDAILDHVTMKRGGSVSGGLFIQVLCGDAGWKNIQNPQTGGVIAITQTIVANKSGARIIFEWACNAVQMCRDLDVLSRGLAQDSVGA